ncbi:MAG: hypothetical protein D6160_07350 [Ketobacter sp.]|nr:MAG: hypothetical protein D6160_07350 [Ketobacter sp.]
MSNMKRLCWFLTACLVLSLIGLTLSSWKMFEFRSKYRSLIEKEVWEHRLSENKIYDNGRIVFFGDSLVRNWPMAMSFGVLPIANKGIRGEMALDALNRFDKDVIALNPKVLIILTGTNDLADGQSVTEIINNIEAMFIKAESKGIKIIVCSLLPVRDSHVQTHPTDSILQINQGLAKLSQQYQADYVDLYSELVNTEGLLKEKFTADGLHPNEPGYFRISRVLLPSLLKYADNFMN